MQEHIERGLLKAEALQAIVFAPALGDFDALLLLGRDALATVPCAALGSKAQRAAAEQCGFSPAAFHAPAEAPQDSGKRSKAILRALPQGESSFFPLADMCKPPGLPCQSSGNTELTISHATSMLTDVQGGVCMRSGCIA